MAQQAPAIDRILSNLWIGSPQTSHIDVTQRWNNEASAIASRVIGKEFESVVCGQNNSCVMLAVAEQLGGFETVRIRSAEIDSLSTLKDVRIVQFTSKYAPLAGLGTPESPLGMSLLSCARLMLYPSIGELANVNTGARIRMQCSLEPVMWFSPSTTLAPGYENTLLYTLRFIYWLTNIASFPGLPNGAYSQAQEIDGILTIYKAVCRHVNTILECYCNLLPPEHATVVSNLLAPLSTRYLNWRYCQLPVAFDGARRLIGYITCPEPVCFSGVMLWSANHATGFRTISKGKWPIFTKMVCSDNSERIPSPADSLPLHYALRACAQLPNQLPSDGRNDLPAFASRLMFALMRRAVGLCHIVSQYSDGRRVACVRDLSEFPTNASMDDPVRALSQLVDFGKPVQHAGDDDMFVGLVPPGVGLTILPGYPAGVFYHLDVAANLSSNEKASMNASLCNFYRRRQAMVESNSVELKSMSASQALLSPGCTHFATSKAIMLSRKRVGQRLTTVAECSGDSTELRFPTVGLTDVHTLPPLANPRPLSKCHISDPGIMAQVKRCLSFHVTMLQRPDDAPAESADVPESTSSRKRPLRTGSVRRKRIHPDAVATSTIFSALVYYMNFCQNIGPGLLVGTNNFNDAVTEIRRSFGVEHDLHGPRCVFIVDRKSPLFPLAMLIHSRQCSAATSRAYEPTLHNE